MKLIDLLVQELPKRGGWPEGVEEIKQCWDGQVWYDDNYAGIMSPAEDARRHGEAFDLRNGVYRAQYESALSASKQPAWNGDGLPPVGCECEAMMPDAAGPRWQWRKVKVAVSGIPGAEKECLVYDIDTTSPAWVDEFRPIRTKAERKREEAIADMRTSLGHAAGLIEVANIYRAIADGRIRGVKLEADHDI